MKEREYKLYCLGCRGSHPVFGAQYLEFGGQTSCYVIKCEDYAMVIDCGTGLYEARELLSDCEIVDVFLTHIHYDHVLGLLDFNVSCSLVSSNSFFCFSASKFSKFAFST